MNTPEICFVLASLMVGIAFILCMLARRELTRARALVASGLEERLAEVARRRQQRRQQRQRVSNERRVGS